MAEHAESRYQKFTPILELVQSANLMNEKDFTKWKTRIKSFEYKLTQPARTLDLFVSYCLAIRELYGIMDKDRNKDTEPQRKVIQEELKNLLLSKFGTSVRDYRHDMKYWEFRINLLNEMGFRDKVIVTYHECIKVHGPSVPQIYIEFSNYAYHSESNKDAGFKTALAILMKGIRFHPHHIEFYIHGLQLSLEHEQYKLNLANTTTTKKSKSHQKPDFRMAEKLYEEGTKILESTNKKNQLLSSYHVKCFNILENYSFASGSDLIIKIMEKI